MSEPIIYLITEAKLDKAEVNDLVQLLLKSGKMVTKAVVWLQHMGKSVTLKD